MKNLTFYQIKYYQGLLKIIFYKNNNREHIEQTLLLPPFIEDIHYLQLKGYLNEENCFLLTEKGMSLLDNSYNIGRMSFVKFTFDLLRSNSVERIGSFISRLLNISARNEEVMKETVRHLTPNTVEHLRKYVNAKSSEVARSKISTTDKKLSAYRADNTMNGLR